MAHEYISVFEGFFKECVYKSGVSTHAPIVSIVNKFEIDKSSFHKFHKNGFAIVRTLNSKAFTHRGL